MEVQEIEMHLKMQMYKVPENNPHHWRFLKFIYNINLPTTKKRRI